MSHNKLFKAISVISAFSIVFSMCSVTAFADEGEIHDTPVVRNGGSASYDNVVVDGATTPAITATGGATVEVSGVVAENPGNTATPNVIVANGSGTNVQVGGNVYTTSEGVAANNGATITIGRDLIVDDTAIVADGRSTVNVGGGIPQSSKGVDANDHSIVNVGGTISATLDKGVKATNGSTVRVNGNIGTSDDHDEYTMNPDVGVYASDGSTVTINGEVNADKKGVEAYAGSRVTVEKDINAVYPAIETDPPTNFGVLMERSDVTVNGSIYSGDYGVEMRYGGDLIVKGDVEGDVCGIALDMQPSNNQDYIVIVEGTVRSEDGYALYVAPPTSQPTEAYATEIAVHKLEASEGKAIGVLGDTTGEMVAVIERAINYIINFQNTDNAGTISNYDTYQGRKTMKKDGSVTISVNDGYYLQGSGDITITPNGDGTFTITMKEGSFGGIDIWVLKKAIDEVTGGGDYIPQDENPNPVSTNPNIVVTNGTTATPVVADGAVTPARTVSFNISDVTPSEMKEAIVNNISATPAGGTLRIETDKVSCLDEAMLQSFADKGNIDIELIFTHNGQRMRIVIPRGTDIRKLIDASGYCGYLRLAELLGYQII